ncbi:Dicer-like protein 2 [Sticta canariensis]|nr:Dicer-like protein 2 [Sticta canariensis]
MRVQAKARAVEAVVRDMTLGQHGNAPPPKALGDMVEAVIGAVYVDSGFHAATTWKLALSNACHLQLIEKLLAPLPTPETVVIHPVRHLGEHAAQQGQTLGFDIGLPDQHKGCAEGRAAACTCVAVTAKIGEQVVGRYIKLLVSVWLALI